MRGVYARRSLTPGQVLTKDDVYFAIPLQHGQISVREFVCGETLRRPVAADGAIHLRDIDSDYSNSLVLQRLIEDRGVAPAPVGAQPSFRRAASLTVRAKPQARASTRATSQPRSPTG